jgi:putative two-component system response regulator
MAKDEILQILGNLMEYREQGSKDHEEHTVCFLRILTSEAAYRELYPDVLQNWDLENFFQSAKLHDIGNLAIKDNLLVKPAPLTPEEFSEVKKHTIYGEDIINKLQRNMPPEDKTLIHARNSVVTHHEKWDGSGYPLGLTGKNIPLEGRLMALADVFNALVSERPYKKALGFDEALDEIKAGKGRHFDPLLTDAFVASSRHLKGINLLWSLRKTA